jgi:hypothetical protein
MAQNEPVRDNAVELRGSNSLQPAKEDLAKIEPGQERKSGNGGTTGGGANIDQQKTDRAAKPKANKGLGHFAISDLEFDVVALVYEKSKALQAYDLYLRDAQANQELMGVMEQIAADDRRHVEMLRGFLGKV